MLTLHFLIRLMYTSIYLKYTLEMTGLHLLGLFVIFDSFVISEAAKRIVDSANNYQTYEDNIGGLKTFSVQGGKALKLDCVDDTVDKAIQGSHKTTSWLKNNLHLKSENIFNITGENLLIGTTTGNDAGIYLCVQMSKTVWTFNVTVEGPYFWHHLPPSVVTSLNSDIDLECKIYGLMESHKGVEVSTTSNVTVDWLHNENMMKKSSENCSLNRDKSNTSCVRVQNGVLSLTNIQVADAGRYMCTATDLNQNHTFSLQTVLHVHELLTFVNHWPHSIHMTSGETLQLSCAVTLRSGFSLAWDKDGEVFRRSTVANDTNMTNGKLEVIELHDLNVSDSGVYTCTVRAGVQIKQLTVLLVTEMVNGTKYNDNPEQISLSQWSMKDQVLLGFSCVLTLLISVLLTVVDALVDINSIQTNFVGTMIYCHRNPNVCSQCSLCRIDETSTGHCYFVHNGLDNSRGIRPSSSDGNDLILNESSDHPLKFTSASLSFANPVFVDENDNELGIHDIHPGDHENTIGDDVCLKIKADAQSLDSTSSEPHTSCSDISCNRQRQLSGLSV